MKAEFTLEEAQRQLASLLAQAAPGEMFFISQQGAKLAVVTKLSLSSGPPDGSSGEPALIDLARSIRARVKPGSDSIKEMISAGRP